MQTWDLAALETFFCRLGQRELGRCAYASRDWREALDPCKRAPWRTALFRACPGLCDVFHLHPQKEEIVARWPGIEVVCPGLGSREVPGQLLALPLRAVSRQPVHNKAPSKDRVDAIASGLDCRSLTRRLASWHPNSESFPVCPMCAGVAYYQGPLFSSPDIETGWHAYLLCDPYADDCSAALPPFLATTWMNMGILDGPPVAVQLRPVDAGQTEPLQIDGLKGIWRSPGSSAAECILSVSVTCSSRLCLKSVSLEQLGFSAFFCEQAGKYALTSRTRVGRYLDDQPALMPRAHVFGVAHCTKCKDMPHKSALEEIIRFFTVRSSEPCPFCGIDGLAIRDDIVHVQSQGAEKEVLEQPFQGKLWICSTRAHLWGWRARRAMVGLLDD